MEPVSDYMISKQTPFSILHIVCLTLGNYILAVGIDEIKCNPFRKSDMETGVVFCEYEISALDGTDFVAQKKPHFGHDLPYIYPRDLSY
jgi:hypothetical protein